MIFSLLSGCVWLVWYRISRREPAILYRFVLVSALVGGSLTGVGVYLEHDQTTLFLLPAPAPAPVAEKDGPNKLGLLTWLYRNYKQYRRLRKLVKHAE